LFYVVTRVLKTGIGRGEERRGGWSVSLVGRFNWGICKKRRALSLQLENN
jgi:hypothetical protein